VGVVKTPQKGGKLTTLKSVPFHRVLAQFVESPLDAETFRVELQRASVTVGHDRFHLATGKRLTFGHRIAERMDTLQEFPVIAHQEPIICRRIVPVLWAARPILFGVRS
jgi:hypothetical protein